MTDNGAPKRLWIWHDSDESEDRRLVSEEPESANDGADEYVLARSIIPAPREDGYSAGVRAALEQGGGVWRSCTGCYETDEGYPTAPIDPVFGCERGAGCRECGGIGAVWDSTDYSDMADWIGREELKDEQIRAALRMADETFRDLGWHAKFEVTSAALKVLALEAEPEPNQASFRAGVRAALKAIPLPPMPVNPTEFSAGARHAYLAARAAVKALLSAEAEVAPEPDPSARVKEALVKLEAAASEVSRIGASPGPQWPPLRTAIITAKAALNAISPTFAPASWKDACRVKNGSDICEEPCARCAAPAAGPALGPEGQPAPLPVAWKILLRGLPSHLTENKFDAELAAKVDGVIVVPLYMHPAPVPYAVPETGYGEFKRHTLATIAEAVGISFRPAAQARKAAAQADACDCGYAGCHHARTAADQERG